MADLVMIGLGPYRFSTTALNIQKVDRRWEYRWVPQNRIGRRPAMQFLGPGEETVSLDGVIYPHYMGGFGQLERLRQEAASGRFFDMGSGMGVYHGLWCVRAIMDQQTHFHRSGAPLKVEFRIDLAAYGPDGGGSGISIPRISLASLVG